MDVSTEWVGPLVLGALITCRVLYVATRRFELAEWAGLLSVTLGVVGASAFGLGISTPCRPEMKKIFTDDQPHTAQAKLDAYKAELASYEVKRAEFPVWRNQYDGPLICGGAALVLLGVMGSILFFGEMKAFQHMDDD